MGSSYTYLSRRLIGQESGSEAWPCIIAVTDNEHNWPLFRVVIFTAVIIKTINKGPVVENLYNTCVMTFLTSILMATLFKVSYLRVSVCKHLVKVGLNVLRPELISVGNWLEL